MMTLQTCPSRNPLVVFQLVDGQAVLVNPERGKVQVINEVGARIWEGIDGLRTVAQIAELICQEFEVQPAQAQTDVLNFLRLLAEKGLCVG